ncbi:DNA polymerase III, alpha subunit [Rhodoblastus acidophilus]|uniref:DNA polymerase III subunit alpha n=1 Tax=Rhodoblastus acidophilus TaxID=1074 RepID=A0A212RHE6_RHOAC|nr:DNA polymerase III subunit alpha [Rhodoblastus acidophilus]PPQ39579.1 DNA polymerase III subunit alpha [Rhodoblastus acidophilus]RAI24362.1 DNA polymerase III subunit alpha [Rhodoblastus acidophilus]SNB71642.1 DNA polymerase III, alpha subunit [Rhodoblastus acidophilus]
MTSPLDEVIEKVGFVHLHAHTSFSLREGALPLAKLLKLALADGQPALAITDTNNLFGALEFAEKGSKEGLQPIPGVQLAVDFADAESLRVPGEPLAGDASLGNLVLLAMDEAGYLNLMKLVSSAWTGVDPGDVAHITLAQLRESNEGLIALTGGPSGPLDRAFVLHKDEAAAARLDALSDIFPRRLYIELQRHGTAREKQVEPLLLDCAYRRDLPLVATNEPYFAAKSDYDAHDALLCIAEGALVSDDNRRKLTPEHRFKTRAEMLELFADLPEATRATVEIALRCAFRPKTRGPILPNFTEGTDEAAELRAQAIAGLKARLDAHGLAPGQTPEDYDKRLEFELSIIEKMKFPGYFLIVSDFIKWAKSQGIPVGPGRGSGAGSLVAYSLTITDLDPMRFSLLFERFLNPERVSMPDFDIDFCQTRREEVIGYVQRRYGKDRVAQIITFGSFLARGVLRNVGRVLEMPLGQVDKLAKMVPQNPAAPVTLKQAIESEPRLQEEAERDSKVAKLLEISEKLEGLYSNASTHAAGVVIGDRPLDRLVPLYQDPKSDMPATQFNMKWVEPAGLVKFDFLGLKTLTTLATCVNLLKLRGIELDLSKIPLDDVKTYEMLGRGETVGVFQLESAGMRKALAEMRADRFEDIVALVALYRPGPMANIPTYCAVKLGEQDADYIHPKIECVLKETFGVIIYQEQVMQIAQILSGYSLGEADMLRRAMGKKIKAEMDKQRVRFVEGAVSGGLDHAKADEIFDLLAKFADYGFNKSHAAAYALVAYQTAWCKANHPVEFMAASMTLDKSNTDKLAEFRNECMRLGVKVEPPSINYSGVDFEVHPDAEGALTIRYALSAVKGVGEGQAAALVAARGGDKFVSLAEMAQRLNPREVNKKVLESLAAAGAFDELERDRAKAFASMEKVLAHANVAQDEARAGQNALFGGGEPEPLRLNKWDNWSAEERLKHEFDAIGFFLSGHPLDSYQAVLQKLRVRNWASFSRAVKQGASADRLAATVLDRAERRTKSGNKMGIVTLSDASGQYEAILFQEGLNQFRELLEKGACVLVTLDARLDGDDVRARITLVEKLDEAAARIQKGLRIALRDGAALPALAEQLKGRPEGEVTLLLRLDEDSREVEVKLPGKYAINPAVSNAIKTLPGVAEVELV